MPTQEERDAITLAKAAEILDKKAAKESKASQSVVLKAVDDSKKSVVFQALTNVRITDGVEVSAEPGTIGRVGPRFPKRMSITAQTGGFASAGGTVSEARALIGKAVYVNSRIASATIPIWVVDSVETDDSNEYTNQVGITVSLTELIGADLIANGFPLFTLEAIQRPEAAPSTTTMTGFGPESCVSAKNPKTISTVINQTIRKYDTIYGPSGNVQVPLPSVIVPYYPPTNYFLVPFFPGGSDVTVAGRKTLIKGYNALTASGDPLIKFVAEQMRMRGERGQLDAIANKIKDALVSVGISEKRFRKVFMDAVGSFADKDGFNGNARRFANIGAIYVAKFPVPPVSATTLFPNKGCINVSIEGIAFVVSYDVMPVAEDETGETGATVFSFAAGDGEKLGTPISLSYTAKDEFIDGGFQSTGTSPSIAEGRPLRARIYVVRGKVLDEGDSGPSPENLNHYNIIAIMGGT